MPLGYSTQQNFRKIPVLGLVMESGASAPATPVNGQLWYDTGNNKAKVYENGAWLDVYSTAAAGGPAGGDLSGTYPNPQIASGVIVVADTATAFDLGALATAHPTTTDVALNGKKITALADPVASTDAATKAYVDSVAAGLDPKNSVKAASTANLTLSGTQTVDGIALVANDRVLVKDQSTASANGIYLVAAGAWTRATDMDAWAEVPGAFTFVEQGTVNSDSGWVSTADQGGTLGTTAITWAQFSGAGQVTAGSGLTKTGNSLDVGAGTGITVGADTVSLDTAYTDTRYWNATGGETGPLTGMFVMGSAGTGFKIIDATLPQNTKIMSDRIGWSNTADSAQIAGLSLDATANTLMTLGYPTGKIKIDCPDVTFTGDAKGVTASPGDNDTSLATTAFVQAALSTGMRKYAADVGALSAGVALTITHNLNTLDVQVQVYTKSDGSTEWFSVARTGVNTITITSDLAYAANLYRVVVMG